VKNDLIRDEEVGTESSLENALPYVEKLTIYQILDIEKGGGGGGGGVVSTGVLN
jgi:hypothetical protein